MCKLVPAMGDACVSCSLAQRQLVPPAWTAGFETLRASCPARLCKKKKRLKIPWALSAMIEAEQLSMQPRRESRQQRYWRRERELQQLSQEGAHGCRTVARCWAALIAVLSKFVFFVLYCRGGTCSHSIGRGPAAAVAPPAAAARQRRHRGISWRRPLRRRSCAWRASPSKAAAAAGPALQGCCHR